MEDRSPWRSRNVLEIADPGKLSLFHGIFSSEMEFWSYEKERLLRYHGVSFERLSLYLDEIKEIGFTWTHRGEPQFDAVLGRLCDYVPDTAQTEGSRRFRIGTMPHGIWVLSIQSAR